MKHFSKKDGNENPRHEMLKTRIATPHDIPRMIELLYQLFSIEADFTPNPVAQAQGLQLLLESSSAVIFVSENGSQVIGMCTAQIHISTAEGRPVGIVEDVIVDMHHRRQGVGEVLLKKLREWASDHKLARLQLLVDVDNLPAIEFYRRQNWNPTNLSSWMNYLPT